MSSRLNAGRNPEVPREMRRVACIAAIVTLAAAACGPTVEISPRGSAGGATSPMPVGASGLPSIGGTWTLGPPLEVARSEHATAILERRIYLAGGFVGRDTSDSFVALDLATGTWQTLAPLPQPRDHGALVALDGWLYLIGGGILGRGVIARDVWRYDPGTDRWNAIAPLPEG